MISVRYIILGAGPAGLSVANALLDAGEDSFVVIEKENEAGGLCRSAEVDGAPLDMGGGHFLDTRPTDVVEYLFRFMPRAEWNRFDRNSRIRIHGTEMDYPFEANLWQLPIDMQVDYLESIARAGCITGEPMPEKFSDWIRWKLGDRIAEDYMLPYNRKIWSVDLDRLGTYWLHKLPNVSFRDTLRSCLERKRAGKMPAHVEFYYPKKFGYGEVWRRMGERLRDKLRLGEPVQTIDLSTRTVNDAYQAKQIVSTIPWTEYLTAAELPEDVKKDIESLEYASIDVGYHPESNNGDPQWIYIPDETLPHHRLLNRYTFCAGSRGYWTERNVKRSDERRTADHADHAGLSRSGQGAGGGGMLNAQGSMLNAQCSMLNAQGKGGASGKPGTRPSEGQRPTHRIGSEAANPEPVEPRTKNQEPRTTNHEPRTTNQEPWNHINQYAYPLNLIGKPEAVARILEWGRAMGIIGLGRWGEWEHMNSDVAVAKGIALAKELT